MLLGAHLITDSHPVASGAAADIYEGDTDGRKVCVKRVRIYSDGDTWGTQKVRPSILSVPVRHSQRAPKVLPGGCDVEVWEAPKHCPLPKCYNRSPPTHFGLDVRRKHNGIY